MQIYFDKIKLYEQKGYGYFIEVTKNIIAELLDDGNFMAISRIIDGIQCPLDDKDKFIALQLGFNLPKVEED